MRPFIHHRRIGTGVLLGAGLALLAGCLTPGEYVPTVTYTVVPRLEVAQTAPSGKTLGIRPLDPAESLRDQVAYRESEYVIRYYPSAAWAEPPRDVVTRAIRDALVQTGHFADVGDARDIRADLILTGELRNFEEVRTAEGVFGQVTARLEVRSAKGDAAVWADTLTVREPLPGEGPAALAAALSQATARLAEQATAAIVQRTGG